MGVVIEICKKHPGGRTRMRVTEIAGTVATVSHGRRLGVYYINIYILTRKQIQGRHKRGAPIGYQWPSFKLHT